MNIYVVGSNQSYFANMFLKKKLSAPIFANFFLKSYRRPFLLTFF